MAKKRKLPEPSDELRPGCGESYYARWLRLGLREFHFEQKGAAAFRGLGQYYGRNPAISYDIAEAVRSLPHRDQEDFRSAVAQVIREIPFDDPENAPLISTLLAVAEGVQARDALFDIATKAFTLVPGRAANRIISSAFFFARDLALTSGRRAEDCLKHIVSSQPAFPDSFAVQALEALTEANPAHFRAHFELLRDRLDRILGNDSPGARNIESLRKRRALLVRNIRKLGVPTDDLVIGYIVTGDPRPESTNWWLEAVISELGDA
ncbi:MAG: hypothetical protein NXH88_19625, partial [Hyphomonas sp.]|nr:hypothetical protein [Hyphomonas sp.]